MGSATASLALVGAAMGLKAVVMVFILSFVLYLPCRLLNRALTPGGGSAARWPPTIFVFCATVLLLAIWDPAHMFVGRLIPGPF